MYKSYGTWPQRMYKRYGAWPIRKSRGYGARFAFRKNADYGYRRPLVLRPRMTYGLPLKRAGCGFGMLSATARTWSWGAVPLHFGSYGSVY